jgi:hypothetical protein
VRVLAWNSRQILIARMALTQLSHATDTGEEKAMIAEMLADLQELSEQESR